MTEKNPNGFTKFLVVMILMIIATVFIGYEIGQYSFSLSQPTQDRWLVGFPHGAAVFSIHQGNWTVVIVGTNPLLEFTSSNKTEAEQWAINQTK